jgi:hypothetical protein
MGTAVGNHVRVKEVAIERAEDIGLPDDRSCNHGIIVGVALDNRQLRSGRQWHHHSRSLDTSDMTIDFFVTESVSLA